MKVWSDEPAFVLHRYPWSESSLILEVLTRHAGRVAILAKGAKKPHSNFRSVLMPLQRLSMTFRGEQEVRTLSKAEWQAGHALPQGEALMAGFYLNELMLKLLARDDAHVQLFDWYAQVVEILASDAHAAIAAVLRSFELLMLDNLGFLPPLDHEGTTLSALEQGRHYHLDPELGLSAVSVDQASQHALSGQEWLALDQAMLHEDALLETLRWCVQRQGPSRVALQTQIRQIIHHQAGHLPFKTRQFMVEVQALHA